MKRGAIFAGLWFVAVGAVACDGPSMPTMIEGEPVCADFELGASRTKMRGGLRRPVRLRVLEGEEIVATVTVNGLRTADAQATRFLLTDANAEYTLEWSQCENERAPHPVGGDAGKKGAPQLAESKYECGEAKVYASEKLVSKKGEAANRKLAMPAPPETGCWTSTELPAASASASASAAPPPPEPPPTASAEASAAASASAAPAAGSAAPAAGSAAPAAPAP